MAVCCGAPVLIGAFAVGGLALLAVRGVPWFLVAVAGVIGAVLVGVIVWRRRRAASCDIPDRPQDVWRPNAS
jgi:glucose dehydrogenase